MTSIPDFLSPTAVAAAIADAKAPNSFQYKSFFQKTGMINKSAEQVRKIFNILDRDTDGVLIEDEISFVLKAFDSEARKLTPAEIAAFIEGGHPIIKGKISSAEFEAMVRSAKD